MVDDAIQKKALNPAGDKYIRSRDRGCSSPPAPRDRSPPAPALGFSQRDVRALDSDDSPHRRSARSSRVWGTRHSCASPSPLNLRQVHPPARWFAGPLARTVGEGNH
jgi:hypothetical protein